MNYQNEQASLLKRIGIATMGAAGIVLFSPIALQAFTTNDSLNFVTTNDGLLTGTTNGNATLEVAPRWDSVNRTDGNGTNRSLVGGLEYNYEGGSLANLMAQFTF